MTDRTRVTLAASVLVAVALIAGLVGYLGGNSNNGTGNSEPGSRDSDEQSAAVGLEAGPTRLDDGIPMGFEHSEEGALAAAVTWMPLVNVMPDSERPAGIEQVMVDSEDLPGLDEITIRFAVMPLAGKVRLTSPDEAEVDLATLYVDSDLQQGVGVEARELHVSLAWDGSADDWRVSEMASGDSLDLTAQELAEYRAVWPTGAELGALLVDEVPGE